MGAALLRRLLLVDFDLVLGELRIHTEMLFRTHCLSTSLICCLVLRYVNMAAFRLVVEDTVEYMVQFPLNLKLQPPMLILHDVVLPVVFD